jgi:hypothetical protein
MYLRTTQRRNKDGSVVRYYALAENVRDPEKGHVEARVVHSFGRADRLDRATLERLVRSIRRVLDANAGEAPAGEKGRERAIEIEASFDLGVVHVVEQLWARLGIGAAIAGRLAADERRAPHERLEMNRALAGAMTGAQARRSAWRSDGPSRMGRDGEGRRWPGSV